MEGDERARPEGECIHQDLDADFWVETLAEALSKGTPEIFNTDQGGQFTCDGCTGLLESSAVRFHTGERILHHLS